MRILPINTFMKERDTVVWLIDTLLPSVGYTLLVGQSGVGKSTLALQMCHAMETGTEVLGLKTTKTKTLYIQADSEDGEFRLMLKRILPKGSPGDIGVSIPKGFLGTPKVVEFIAASIEKRHPGFVVFDSLYKIVRQDVNTAKVLEDIRTLQKILKTTPFMILHHPPHDGTRASGHNSLEGDCSNAWMLLKTRLMINKGRLVGGEGFTLKKDKNGLWYVGDDKGKGGKKSGDTAHTGHYDDLTYDEIVRKR